MRSASMTFLFVVLSLFGKAQAPEFDSNQVEFAFHRNVLKVQLLSPFYGNIDFAYERIFNEKRGLQFTVGLPVLRFYQKNYDLFPPSLKGTLGINTGVFWHRYFGKKASRMAVGYGTFVRYVVLKNIDRTYDWSALSDGDDAYSPSKLFPFETSICNGCKATLDEKRLIVEPSIYFLRRMVLNQTLFELQAGIGMRVVAFQYDFHEIRDYGQTFMFDDYSIRHYLVYPVVHLNFGFGAWL